MPEEQFLLLSLDSSIFKAFLKKQGVATTPNRLTYAPQESGMQLGLGSFTLKQRQLFQGVKHGVIVSSHDPRPLPLGSTASDCGESEAGEAHREVHRSRLGQCLVRGSYITYCILSYIIPLYPIVIL